MKLIFSLIVFSFLLTAGLSSAADPSNCININTAPKEELVKIKQIGEARAEQIITLREERPFSSVDDLDRVAGIGPARIADIKEQGLACVKPAEDGPPPLSPKTSSVNLTESSPVAENLPAENSPRASSTGSTNSNASLLLPVAIFTSFSGGVMILVLKKKLKLS